MLTSASQLQMQIVFPMLDLLRILYILVYSQWDLNTEDILVLCT